MEIVMKNMWALAIAASLLSGAPVQAAGSGLDFHLFENNYVRYGSPDAGYDAVRRVVPAGMDAQSGKDMLRQAGARAARCAMGGSIVFTANAFRSMMSWTRSPPGTFNSTLPMAKWPMSPLRAAWNSVDHGAMPINAHGGCRRPDW
jgi:hypothetical protein